MARLLLNGSVPDEATLMTDDLVIQMIQKAKDSGVTKEAVIQALTAEDVPEAIRQSITGELVTKESVIQSLQAEDVPEAVKQKIIEDAKIEIPSVVQKFATDIIQAVKADAGKGTVAGEDQGGEKKKNIYEVMEENTFRI